MRTGVIKIKTLEGAQAALHVMQDNLNSRLLRLLFIYAGVLAFFYVIFLMNMVWNIIERKTVEVKVRTLSTEVADLELAYLNASNKVDLPLSYKMGFKETAATYATRKSVGKFGTLEVSNNEI